MKEYSLRKGEPQPQRARLVMMTPGQGSQFQGMAADLILHPKGAEVLGEANDILGFGLTELMCNPTNKALEDNKIAQPAIVAATIAAREVFHAEHPETTNIIPLFYIGHSLGELTALYFAGVLSAQEALLIAHERGRLMQEKANETPGGMAVVITHKQDMLKVDEICRQTKVYLATYNTPTQVTISGLAGNIQEAIKLIKAAHFGYHELKNVPPSHTPLMEDAMIELSKFIESNGIVFRNPNAPVITNLTGQPEDSGELLRRAFLGQLVNPVRFEQGIEFVRAHGMVNFIEFGPKPLLVNFIPQIFGKHIDKKHLEKFLQQYLFISSVHNIESARNAVLTLKE